MSGAHFQRGMMLYEQSRYEMAETEFRQVLAEDPNNGTAHALLALCLSNREKYSEATEEAQQAIFNEPDLPFGHYAMAYVLHDRNRPQEALEPIGQALHLDPRNADYLALKSGLHFNLLQWQDSLQAAEEGLEVDAEHVACTNMRAMALVKLNRKSEAGQTIDAALARDPENALSQANQGWTCLEQNDPKKAMNHFKEALRLEPDNEWARQGIVEALKARYFIYAIMLRYFLWMSKLNRTAQWGIILGAYFGYQIIRAVARNNPSLAPLMWPLMIGYGLFALMTWIADPLFCLLLRMNRFGRLALSEEQRTASTWLGATLLIAIMGVVAWVIMDYTVTYLYIALVFGLLSLPVSGIFRCSKGWPRMTMAGVTIGLAVMGCLAVLHSFLLLTATDPDRIQTLQDGGMMWMSFFLIGAILSTWLGNFLAMAEVRK